MAKKTEDTKKPDRPQGGKKHETPHKQTDRPGRAVNPGSRGTAPRVTEEKIPGKGKLPGMGDFDEKGMGGHAGKGTGNPARRWPGESAEDRQEIPGKGDLGNFEGIDIGNFDPSADLGKKTSGKGCFTTILGIFLMQVLILVF